MDHMLPEPAALVESRRCMSCGAGAEVLVDKCEACLTCLRVCPFGIPKVTDVARIDSALCQACGMCIAECPAKAIIHRSRSEDELVRRTVQALGGEKGKVVAYVCGHHATAQEWRRGPEAVPGVKEVYLSSMAGLGVIDILRAFQSGAEDVLVIACHDKTDRYPQTNARLRARVEQARTLLREAGIPSARLRLEEIA
jgi:ferredoxin